MFRYEKCKFFIDFWTETSYKKSCECFLFVFLAASCAGWWEESCAIWFAPWLLQNVNAKEQKLKKIVHFDEIFMIFEIKLFLIIQGNIIHGFFLDIRV